MASRRRLETSQVDFGGKVERRRTRFLIAVSLVWRLRIQDLFGVLHGPDENSFAQSGFRKGHLKQRRQRGSRVRVGRLHISIR